MGTPGFAGAKIAQIFEQNAHELTCSHPFQISHVENFGTQRCLPAQNGPRRFKDSK